MNKLLVLSLIFTSFAQAAVFCDIDGKRVSLTSNRAQECVDSLLMGAGVCFNGNRKEAIALLNSEYVRSLFAGTDGEYIANAHFYGPDSIRYNMFDLANDYSEAYRIERCKK
jgi:hypothetical protein